MADFYREEHDAFEGPVDRKAVCSLFFSFVFLPTHSYAQVVDKSLVGDYDYVKGGGSETYTQELSLR